MGNSSTNMGATTQPTSKSKKFKTPEVLEISKTMYDDFFKFFETINSLLCIHENKIINKEEN